jgi:hypothetical protein
MFQLQHVLFMLSGLSCLGQLLAVLCCFKASFAKSCDRWKIKMKMERCREDFHSDLEISPPVLIWFVYCICKIRAAS